MKRLKKYTSVFFLSMQSTMEYRINFILSLFSGAFSIIIQCFVWKAIYDSSSSPNLYGYQYNQMLVYLILAGILSKIMATGFEWDISSDIKNGGFSKFLVQPIRYMPYRIMNFMGQKVIQLFMVSIISLIILTTLGLTMGVTFKPSEIIGFLLSTLLALLLNCFIFYSISAIAFWVTEVWAVFIGLEVATNILNGGIFPLDIFGEKAQEIFSFLPFQYVIYFPLNIINGKYSSLEVHKGMVIQGLWILILFLCSKGIWKAGMKKFTAVGG